MQESGAGPPMADDKNRVIFDRCAFDLSAVPTILQNCQHRVTETDKRDDRRHPPIPETDLKPIVHEQARPGQEMTTLPHVGRPILSPRFLFVVRGAHELVFLRNSLFFQSRLVVQEPSAPWGRESFLPRQCIR